MISALSFAARPVGEQQPVGAVRSISPAACAPGTAAAAAPAQRREYAGLRSARRPSGQRRYLEPLSAGHRVDRARGRVASHRRQLLDRASRPTGCPHRAAVARLRVSARIDALCP